MWSIWIRASCTRSSVAISIIKVHSSADCAVTWEAHALSATPVCRGNCILSTSVFQLTPVICIAGMPYMMQGSGPAWSTALRRRQCGSMKHVDRVVVLPHLSAKAFSDLLSASDVVMDTLPYSSFTVSLEALVLNTPVVTMLGNTLRGYERLLSCDCLQ
jgi:hypothetical protein